MIHRRTLLACGAGLLPFAARPQQVQKVFRIGVLTQTLRPADYAFTLIFDALEGLGYEEGTNVVYEFRSAEGREDRLAALAADLVAKKVDLILAVNNWDVLAAKRATSTIPIVMCFGLAPVESGLVASLARPGGNVTGMVSHDPEMAGKKLDLLRETLPRIARVTYLWDRERPGMAQYQRAAARAAEAMRIRFASAPFSSLAELESALSRIKQERPDALYVTPPPVAAGVNWEHRARFIEFAARERLPAIYTVKNPVTAWGLMSGGLMSHSEDSDASAHQVAAIVDRILKGEQPAEMAIVKPAKFWLTINLKAAKALGLGFPPSLLAKADEVIH